MVGNNFLAITICKVRALRHGYCFCRNRCLQKKECTQKTLLPKLAKSFEIIIVLNVVLLLTPLNFSTGSTGMWFCDAPRQWFRASCKARPWKDDIKGSPNTQTNPQDLMCFPSQPESTGKVRSAVGRHAALIVKRRSSNPWQSEAFCCWIPSSQLGKMGQAKRETGRSLQVTLLAIVRLLSSAFNVLRRETAAIACKCYNSDSCKCKSARPSFLFLALKSLPVCWVAIWLGGIYKHSWIH